MRRDFDCKQKHLLSKMIPIEFQDLLGAANGSLISFLERVVKEASTHVYGCKLCGQKGFICEICANPKVIFPFEMSSTTRVSSVFSFLETPYSGTQQVLLLHSIKLW